jgi:hypothetical protein
MQSLSKVPVKQVKTGEKLEIRFTVSHHFHTYLSLFTDLSILVS